MSVRLFFPTAIAFALACVAACSGSSSSDTTTTTDAGATDAGGSEAACATLATAYCQKVASCGSASIVRRYPDQATCVARETTTCVNAFGAPDITRTAANATACAAAYASATCADVLSGNTPGDCRATSYPGKRAVGAACAFPAQCQSGVCTAARGAACGTCVAAAPAVGAPCPDSCGPGQYCSKASGQCAAYGNLGDACDAQTVCTPTLACAGAVTGQGKCTAPATTVGAACDTSIATGTTCATEDGLTCSSKQCVVGATATTGGACGATKPLLTFCNGGSACNNATGDAGTCVGPAADGTPCDTGNDNACLPGAACIGQATGAAVAGTCTVRTAAMCP